MSINGLLDCTVKLLKEKLVPSSENIKLVDVSGDGNWTLQSGNMIWLYTGVVISLLFLLFSCITDMVSVSCDDELQDRPLTPHQHIYGHSTWVHQQEMGQ